MTYGGKILILLPAWQQYKNFSFHRTRIAVTRQQTESPELGMEKERHLQPSIMKHILYILHVHYEMRNLRDNSIVHLMHNLLLAACNQVRYNSQAELFSRAETTQRIRRILSYRIAFSNKIKKTYPFIIRQHSFNLRTHTRTRLHPVNQFSI